MSYPKPLSEKLDMVSPEDCLDQLYHMANDMWIRATPEVLHLGKYIHDCYRLLKKEFLRLNYWINYLKDKWKSCAEELALFYALEMRGHIKSAEELYYSLPKEERNVIDEIVHDFYMKPLEESLECIKDSMTKAEEIAGAEELRWF